MTENPFSYFSTLKQYNIMRRGIKTHQVNNVSLCRNFILDFYIKNVDYTIHYTSTTWLFQKCPRVLINFVDPQAAI